MNTADYLEQRRIHFEIALAACLENTGAIPQRLYEAMHYTLQNGGKRLRPLLTYATGETLGAPIAALDAPACAVELIHTYSLVHDDLPAMDDADLRRGEPSCHKAFDEATAILVGDALLPLALQRLLNDTGNFTDSQKIQMSQELLQASSATGMVGGQLMDLNLNQQNTTVADVAAMYQKKTGALITACIRMAAVAANCNDAHVLAILDDYAAHIGLAFQIQDDVLDIEVHTDILGKTQGKDIAQNKMTIPALIGVAAAKQQVAELYQQAFACLDKLGGNAEMGYLRGLTQSLEGRGY